MGNGQGHEDGDSQPDGELPRFGPDGQGLAKRGHDAAVDGQDDEGPAEGDDPDEEGVRREQGNGITRGKERQQGRNKDREADGPPLESFGLRAPFRHIRSDTRQPQGPAPGEAVAEGGARRAWRGGIRVAARGVSVGIKRSGDLFGFGHLKWVRVDLGSYAPPIIPRKGSRKRFSGMDGNFSPLVWGNFGRVWVASLFGLGYDNTVIATDFASLRADILRDVRGPFHRSDAPRYSFPLEEALDTFERILAYRTGEKELDDTGPDLIAGLSRYFRDHALTNLPERCEAFARLVFFIANRQGWDSLQPKDGLSALIKRLGLAGNKVLKANELAELEGKPRFAIHVGRVIVARNESAHKAVERSTKEVAEVGESVLVFLLYTVCEHRERLELALFRERVRAAAEDVRRGFAKWESLHVPLEGRERESAGEDGNIGLQLTARELLHDDPADLADLDDDDDDDDDGDDEEKDWEAEGGASRVARSGPILDLVREEPRLVLLGEPGAGKTTSLQFLAWDSAGALLDGAGSGDRLAAFPVFLALQRCKAQSGQALEDHLARELPDGWTLADLGRGTGNWLLLLDGFNEVSADYRDRLAADIRALMDRWPRVRMIVSSRPGVYHDAFRCSAFVLDALDDGRIREFLEKFFARAGKPREADRFHEILSRHPRLKAWGRNPLGLRMLAAVGLRTRDLPANRGRLMESFVGTILVREADKERQQWDAPLKTFFLGHLAFETRRAGRVGFSWEEACGILRTVAERIGHPLDGPAFLRECEYNHLLASAGGLRDQGRAFAHEMYQEYFAAVELLRRRGEEPGLVDALRRNPFWEEPLILYAGLAPDGDEVIRAMGRDQPLLAARSLTSQLEPAAEVQADVVARAENAARIFYGAERSSAGLLALLELGDVQRLQRIFLGIDAPTRTHKRVVEQVVCRLEFQSAVRFLLALAELRRSEIFTWASDAWADLLERRRGQCAPAELVADPAAAEQEVWALLLLPAGWGIPTALPVARECGVLDRLDADRLLSKVIRPCW